MTDTDRYAKGIEVLGRVGFVGLGRMGWPMASSLAKAGAALVVHDADADVSAAFAREHGATAASAREDFAGIIRVITMLPDDRVVRDALLRWDGGIASALGSRAVIVDMSSSNPEGTKALEHAIREWGVRVVDAPVSGGVPRAQDGSLAIMVGGGDGDVEAVMALLEVLGRQIHRTGPLGSGHAMKALNNYVAATTYLGMAEALEVGRHFGLSPQTIVGIVNASTGRSFVSEVVYGEHVVPGAYATGFRLGLLAKDVGIAGELARAVDVDAGLLREVDRRWSAASEALGGESDHSEAHRHWWPATARPRTGAGA
jgi:3-hydroxyisobutyrate dehydrogenase